MTSLSPGQVFDGKFRVEHPLGEGGFATVYAAIDELGRPVALKVLKRPAEGYDAGTTARFTREVELVSRLTNPHTVRFYGAGQSTAGELYAVFERVPGEDLIDLLERRGRLSPNEVVHILGQLLDALDEAHRKGLLHRDLKPENVRVFAHEGDHLYVKLLDFGIARATDDGHPSITRTGELVGTPKYMSPEQLLGRALTPASDIYSLGVVIFELLLGREAMGGTGWGAQLERLQSGHVFSLPEMQRIGARLLSVLQRMTARDPKNRYPSAPAVVSALRQIEAPSSGAKVFRSTREPTAQRARWPLAAAAVVVFMGCLSYVAIQRLQQPPEASRPGKRTHVPLVAAEASQPKAKPRAAEPPAATEPGMDMAALDAAQPDLAAVPLPPEDPRGGTKGCGKEPAFVGYGNLHGVTLPSYVPTGYRKNYKHPLILLLHQDGERSGELLAISGFADHSEPDHFVVVAPAYPQILSSWRGDWDDMPLLEKAVKDVGKRLCIDPKRVFVVGNSQGGRAAHFASCTDWVAGIGTFAFASGNAEHHCQPAPRKPIVMITPTRSPHAPLEGGKSCTSQMFAGIDDDGRTKFSVHQMEELWRERNRCSDASPEVRKVGPHSCYTWDCASMLHSCHADGGHGWPGSEPRAFQDVLACAGPPATDFDAAGEFWRAFRQIGMER